MMTRLLLLLVCATVAPAQSLSVNGSEAYGLAPLGATLHLTLQGPAGAPVLWGFSTGAGPTPLGSQLLPLDVTSMVEVAMGLPMPPSGSIALNLPVPMDPNLAGLTLHSAAIFLDPSQPDGFLATNGVAFTLVIPGADAGPDAVSFTGGKAILNGSGNLLPTGGLPPGHSLIWILRDAPAGSAAVIAHENYVLPNLEPDLPGSYLIEVQVQTPAGLSADLVRVDAYELSLSSPVDGSFHRSPVNVSGTIDGPGPATLELNGVSIPVSGPTPFAAGTLDPGDPVNTLVARVTTSAGAVAEQAFTVLGGSGAPLGTVSQDAALVRIEGATLDALEVPAEVLLANFPLDTLVTSLPPLTIIDQAPLLSATFTFTQATYDPDVDVDIFPSSGHIGIAVTINNLAISADADGVILFAPYSETASITAASVVVTGELLVGAAPSGALEFDIQNAAATLNSFAFTVTGPLGGVSQIGLIQSGLQTAIEAALAGVLDLLPAAINPLLAGFVPSIDMGPLTVSLPLSSVGYDSLGLTLGLGFLSAPTIVDPGAPQPAAFFSTPSQGLPVFASLTPLAGSPYDLAFGVDDDLLNQALAGLLAAGALRGVIDPGPGLDAGALALLLPGQGFEAFDPAAPVSIAWEVRSSPPVVTQAAAAGSGAQACWHVGDLHFVFQVEDAADSVPVLDMGASFSAGLDLVIDPLTGALSLGLSQPLLALHQGAAVAGADGTMLLAAVSPLIQNLLSVVTGPLSGITLPLGGTLPLAITEISVDPLAPGMIITWVDLP